MTDTPEKNLPLIVHTRQLEPRDMWTVLQIEKDCFKGAAWDATQFASCKPPEFLPLVAIYEGKVVGYAIGQYQNDTIELLKIAVHPGHRREEVGTQLIEKIREKLQVNGCSHIHLTIDDKNTDAIRFFTSKNCGFEVAKIDHDNGTYRLEYEKFKHLPRAEKLGHMKTALERLTDVKWDIVQATNGGHYIKVGPDQIAGKDNTYAVRTERRIKNLQSIVRPLAYLLGIPSTRLSRQVTKDPINLTINEDGPTGKGIRQALDPENKGMFNMSSMAIDDMDIPRIRDARQVGRREL